MALEYVFRSNIGEHVGTQTMNETKKLLKKYLEPFKDTLSPKTYEKREKETINTYIALEYLHTFRQEVPEDDGSVVCRSILTEEIIKQTHRLLMPVDGGDYRHDKTDHRLVSPLMGGLVDIYNSLLLTKVSNEEPRGYHESLIKLSTWILFNFVDIHPFGDGNGRMCRLLANHVLSAVSPFPVSIFHDNVNRISRDVYIDAIESCRWSKSRAPSDIAAMIVESIWRSWKSLFKILEENQLLMDQEIMYVFVKSDRMTDAVYVGQQIALNETYKPTEDEMEKIVKYVTNLQVSDTLRLGNVIVFVQIIV